MTPYDFYSREQSLALLMGAIPQRGNFGWGAQGIGWKSPTGTVAMPTASGKVVITSPSRSATPMQQGGTAQGVGWKSPTGTVAMPTASGQVVLTHPSAGAMSQPVYMGPSVVPPPSSPAISSSFSNAVRPPPPPPVPLQAQSPGLHATALSSAQLATQQAIDTHTLASSTYPGTSYHH